MIHFKNKGFTLIETLFATAIMAMLLTPLFVTQATIFQNLFRATMALQRIFLAENFLINARIEAGEVRKYTYEKKIDDPETAFKYQLEPISSKSSLKDIEDLVTERVTITWNEGKKKNQEVLIMYLYRPEPEPPSENKK